LKALSIVSPAHETSVRTGPDAGPEDERGHLDVIMKRPPISEPAWAGISRADHANHGRFLFPPRDRSAALRPPCRLPPLEDKNLAHAVRTEVPGVDPKLIFGT